MEALIPARRSSSIGMSVLASYSPALCTRASLSACEDCLSGWLMSPENMKGTTLTSLTPSRCSSSVLKR
jgi:hypothetical protein